MADFGVSFVPTDSGPQSKQNPLGGPGGAAPFPVQQAIQLLSLRLPRVLGANALAPGPLLNSPGGGGGLYEALRQMYAFGRPGSMLQSGGAGQGGGTAGAAAPSSPLATPPPRVEFGKPPAQPAPSPPQGQPLANDYGARSMPQGPQPPAPNMDWLTNMFGPGSGFPR